MRLRSGLDRGLSVAFRLISRFLGFDRIFQYRRFCRAGLYFPTLILCRPVPSQSIEAQRPPLRFAPPRRSDLAMALSARGLPRTVWTSAALNGAGRTLRLPGSVSARPGP